MGKSELVTYNGALVVRRPWDCSGGSTGWLLWCFATLTPTLLTRSTALAPVTTNNGGGTAPPCSADKLNEHCTRSRSRSACKVVLGRIGGGAGGQCFVAALRAGAGGSCTAAPVLVLVVLVLVYQYWCWYWWFLYWWSVLLYCSPTSRQCLNPHALFCKSLLSKSIMFDRIHLTILRECYR